MVERKSWTTCIKFFSPSSFIHNRVHIPIHVEIPKLKRKTLHHRISQKANSKPIDNSIKFFSMIMRVFLAMANNVFRVLRQAKPATKSINLSLFMGNCGIGWKTMRLHNFALFACSHHLEGKLIISHCDWCLAFGKMSISEIN